MLTDLSRFCIRGSVEIGKQLLITRRALTTCSTANDEAQYFAIIPAIFVTTYP
jgi:K+-transporting ATPase ATPase B chain